MSIEFTAAVTSTKVLLDLLKAAASLKNYSEFVTAVYDVQAKLMDAAAVALASQQEQMALTKRNRELEDKIAEAEDYKAQLKRYSLHEFPGTRALAYALKPAMQDGEPMHYLCTACMDKRQISKLQPDDRYLNCHACGLNIEAESSPPHRPRPPRSPMAA